MAHSEMLKAAEYHDLIAVPVISTDGAGSQPAGCCNSGKMGKIMIEFQVSIGDFVLLAEVTGISGITGV